METEKYECQKCGRKDDLFRISALNPNKSAKFYCGDHMAERDQEWHRPESEAVSVPAVIKRPAKVERVED